MRDRPRLAEGSGARVERVRRRGARIWDGGIVEVAGRETLEVLRDGGPRKREGGGAR